MAASVNMICIGLSQVHIINPLYSPNFQISFSSAACLCECPHSHDSPISCLIVQANFEKLIEGYGSRNILAPATPGLLIM